MNARARQTLVVILAVAIVGLIETASFAAQPQLKMLRDDKPVVAGKPYRVVLEVTWEGAANEFTILPAEIDPVKWGRIRVTESQAFDRDGRHVVRETIELIADNPGTYQVPEMRISLSSPEATVPSELPDLETTLPDPGAYPMLKTDPFPLRVRSDRSLTWYSGGLGALLLLLLVAVLGWLAAARRRPAPSANDYPDSPIQLAQAALIRARRARNEGDFYAFYLALHDAVCHLGSGASQTSLAERLAEQAQDAGYRGMKPTHDQMDGDLKDVERCLAQQP